MRAWLLALLVSITALWPGAAMAEGTDPAAAELLFQKGRDAMVIEDYDAACQFFLESLSLDQAVGTVMNLAVCEEKRGHLTSSWERWHQALRLLDPNDDRFLFAEDQLNWISARLAHLTIRLTGASPKDLTIKRDGVVLGAAALGQELPVDPGTHTVTVESKRFEPKSYTVTLESGEAAALVVSPGAAKPVPAKPSSDGQIKTRRAIAYASFGVGAAGLATAIVTGLLLPAQDQKVQENCPGMVCNAVGTQAISDAQVLLALNTTGWIATGVGVAAGSVLLLTTLPRTKKPTDAGKPTQDSRPRKKAAGVTSSVAITATGILVRGTF